MNREDAPVPRAVRREIPAIARAVDGIVARFAAGGRLIYVGAGTSGRLGALDAAECPPTFGVRAKAGARHNCGRESRAAAMPSKARKITPRRARETGRARGLRARRCVVGIAASGATPFVLGALKFAMRKRGAFTVADRQRRNRAARLAKIAHRDHRAGTGREVHRRLDANESRHGAEIGAQHALDGGDGAAWLRLRQPDDRRGPSNEKLRRRALRISGGGERQRVASAERALRQSAARLASRACYAEIRV